MATLACNDGPVKRTLEMPVVGERTYYLYIPLSLCSDDDAVVPASDTVPLVFAVHCLGCTAQNMMHLTKIADSYAFVMVIPEGLSSSWNSKYCCGYALDNNVDDVGFLAAVIDTVEKDAGGLVSKDVVYGMGWSNGGYMVTYAAGLFRAIAPISGHVYNVQEDIFPVIAAGDTTKAIFMHHSVDDPSVRMTGCCTDPSMPQCCCGISQHGPDKCISAEGVLQSWAVEVNGCLDSSSMSVSMEDTDKGITCHTINADGCRSNATICIHAHDGHFNNPSFEAKFTMNDEVGSFFAREACSTNGGTWSADARTCECDSGVPGSGRYCLLGGLAGGRESATPSAATLASAYGQDQPPSSGSFLLVLGAVVVVLSLFWLLPTYLAWQWVKQKRPLPVLLPRASDARKEVEMGSLMADRDLRS